MLEGGIIAKLLDEKWSTFAKVHFPLPHFLRSNLYICTFVKVKPFCTLNLRIHTCQTYAHCKFAYTVKIGFVLYQVPDCTLISCWQGFFIKRLAILILHLITVSMAVYQRPNIKFSLVRGIKEGTGDITTEDVSRSHIYRGNIKTLGQIMCMFYYGTLLYKDVISLT